MDISKEKTKTLYVRAQDPISETTNEESNKICKFTCRHLHCGHKFLTKSGLLIHENKCDWRNEFEIENILACKGPVVTHKYLIRWKGYDANHDSWVPRSNLHPEDIRDFEVVNGLYIHDRQFRCHTCDLSCVSRCGIKIHISRVHKEDKSQCFKGLLTDAVVWTKKIKDQQEYRPVVNCEDTPLENVFRFKYLGSVFAADGMQLYDVKERIVKSDCKSYATCDRLRHIFDSPSLDIDIKLRLYVFNSCRLFGTDLRV